jgi:hypothetical protein
MADISDVENALVSSIAGLLFSTAYSPYSVQTSDKGLPGLGLRLMRGWPVDSQLVLDLKAGITTISVFSDPKVARNITNRLMNTTTVNTEQVTPTMLATLSGNQVTFSGTTNTGQTIGIGIRPHNGGYSYRLLNTDTPSTVAATFAANITGATANGAVLTLPALSSQIVVQLGGDVTTWTEVHRQQQIFMVTVWSPTVAIRDQLCGFLDPNLIHIRSLSFPDHSVSGPVIGAGTNIDDVVQKEYMWKRCLYYCIEYATGYVEVLPVMTLGKDNISGSVTLID